MKIIFDFRVNWDVLSGFHIKKNEHFFWYILWVSDV